ncbi:cadmium-translocating P-type ATPase [Candidatus Bathyarchaeota archaeon]|nr:cadmium-translocating P-type ATPase [Candidatus Bathyarchaeota archaeon]
MTQSIDRGLLKIIENILDKWRKSIQTLSPAHDVRLFRVVTAAISIVCFIVHSYFASIPVLLIGIIFYTLCLSSYLEGFLHNILLEHRVSAELLIVSVMIVSPLNGQPLSGALVAWFIGLGLFISFTIMRRNREKISALIGERKRTARVMRGEELREMPIEDLREGDIVIVPKGEIIPVDGVISEGRSLIDESSITGEPFPVLKRRGDEVVSGSINLSAPIQVKALKNVEESFISIVASEIERSLKIKSRLQKRADKIAQILISSVVAYSFLLLFITRNLTITAAALAVMCPCAWALATPTAFASTIGRLAREHILVKGGEPLERVNEAKFMLLDKTGTLTLAEPEVREVIPLKMPERALLEIAASVESRFNHPIANSISRYTEKRGIRSLRDVKGAEDIPGRGVKAMVEGKEVVIGSSETLSSMNVDLPDVKYDGRGIWVAVNREPAGVIVIQDVMHTHAENLADKIRRFGVKKVILVTGDGEKGEAKRVAEKVNVDEFYYNCKPEDKASLVRKLRSEGSVVMVGDGVNDAPALAAADVGIAIGGHRNVDLAIKSSDIVILSSDIVDLLKILRSSERMKKVLKQDYTWAIAFNAVGLLLATFGLLNPIIAAGLHHISSVFVVSNAARIYLEA